MWAVNVFFFFQAEDGIRDRTVTGVQTCALPISSGRHGERPPARGSVRVPRDAGRAGATVEIGGTTMRRRPRPRCAHRHERDRRTVYRGPRVGLPAGFRPYRTVRAHRCGPAPRAPPPRTPGGCYSAGAD